MASSPPPPSGQKPSDTGESSSFSKKYSSWSPSSLNPLRHHQRKPSATRKIKETKDARRKESNSEDDAARHRINQYLIQQEIGRGSFGSVHLAIDQFGKEYAVKEFSKHRLRRRAKSNLLRQSKSRQSTGLPGLLDAGRNPQSKTSDGIDEDAFNLIKEEIAIMKKLNHDNLVSLIEVLDDPDGDSLYMVMDMCKKGVVMQMEIDQTVEGYNEDNCRYWFRDLLLGIEYLHAQGVVHRDIKPDNCLVTEDNTLKLVDFGVSEMFERGSDMKLAKSAGSPAFMAPELCIIRKDGVAGKPADIWSMGVTLYCLRFGRVPFQKSNMLDLYEAIEHEEPDLSHDCTPELADLLRRLLEKDPDKRITMDDIRQHPWVTRNGQDKLVSAEDNCAESIEAPTEEEMNTAITDNMGHLIVVLKAANKFKSLLERHHPELMDSILGRASKMVAPPLTMTGISDAGSSIKSKLKRHLSGKDDPSDFGMTGSGIYRAKDLDKEEANISERMKATGISKPTRSATEFTLSHQGDGTIDSGRGRDPRERQRHSYDDNIKGHAHNILEDQIFVDIGTGPYNSDGEEHDEDSSDYEHHYIVSESPSGTDDPVFERAYEKKVKEIESTGMPTTIYKTRRIDKMREKLHKSHRHSESEVPTYNPKQSFKSIAGSAMGRAMQSGGQKLQNKYDEPPAAT